MPEEISFGTYVFWMGITAFGAGLYFWISKGQRVVGGLITLGGGIAALLVVKQVNAFMNSLTVGYFLGPAVLLGTWGILAYDIYLKKRGAATKEPIIANAHAKFTNEDQIWIWRKMATDTQKDHPDSPRSALATHKDYPSLRPYLSEGTRREIEDPEFPATDPNSLLIANIDPVIRHVLDDVERIARSWGLIKGVEDSQKSTQKQLRIQSATWGSVDTRESVMTQIETKPRNALAFFVNPDNLGGIDPKHGDPDKYLEVGYTLDGLGSGSTIRKQGEWILLPEDPTVARMRAEIGTLNERNKESQSAIGRLIDERGKDHGLQMEIFGIKQTLRLLKERGAPASFMSRPFDRSYWKGDSLTDEAWMKEALAWQERLRSNAIYKWSGDFLASLDFDELMAEIDEYELQQLGFNANFMIASGEAPMVGISVFETREQKYGAWLYNYGSSSALETRVLPASLGKYRMEFEYVGTIVSGDGRAFCPMTTRERRGTMWRDQSLDMIMQSHCHSLEAQSCLPLSLFVEYKDREGHKLCSRNEIQMTESGKLLVFVRRIEMR